MSGGGCSAMTCRVHSVGAFYRNTTYLDAVIEKVE